MKVGCFALVDPFSLLDHQLERIAGMGFKYADVTDNHPGGILGREFGFTATASLDDNPTDVRAMFAKHGLTATSVCAHANLLDPAHPPATPPPKCTKRCNWRQAWASACDHHRRRSQISLGPQPQP